jgi:murein DD-endopeptidase MepM/ murein hydrolase activator NlpD
MFNSGLSPFEVLGINADSARQTLFALRGDDNVPGSRFGPSSLRIFTPRLAVATWAGRRYLDRALPIVNLFNRTPTPVEEGWSVRVTHVRDFRGRALTYDSHNGTDFAVPPGTRVVASAAGRVVAVRHELDRGGLKIYVDHGGGLMTSYHHLARAHVVVGQEVKRGELIALSGYSGIDAIISFPWVAPHVHYNTYLGGVVVDPFAMDGEQSIWRNHNSPRVSDVNDFDFTPTEFDPARIDALLGELKDSKRRALIAGIADISMRAWALVIEANTYPLRFARKQAATILFDDAPRKPTLDLPFDDFDGIAFADDHGLRI